MTIEAVIFDVDGTIADTEEGHRTAFNLAFRRFKLDWNWDRETYRKLLNITGGKERLAGFIDGLSLSGVEKRRLLGRLPDIHAEKTRFYSSMAGDGGIPLRPGIARLIADAKGARLKVAIASTTTRINIDALLRATLGKDGIGLFDCIVCGDQVASKKPAPDVYLKTLEGLGVDADNAIAVEDSPNGLRAAAAAGIRTVVTPTFWTEGSDFAAASVVLPHLGDPWQPIPGEPGRRLHAAAWVTLDELFPVAA